MAPVESRELLGVEYEVQRSIKHKHLVVCVVQPLPGPYLPRWGNRSTSE